MEHLAQFISNHWQLCAALVVILLAIFLSEFISQKKRAKELSTADSIELMNHGNAVVIDLRTVELYRQGHIVGSIRGTEEDFNQKRMDKYQSKPVILVCARGIQSAALAAKLRTAGFTNLQVLAGGITAWQAASLPLIKK